MRDDDRDDRDDDDVLRGLGATGRDSRAVIDLDAWAPPPPPPAGPLADAVVARMRQPVASPAREPAAPAARRRWTIAAAAAAGVALAAAGVLAIARWGTERPPADGRGEVFAARAAHLALGPSSAELDPGAEVRWRRAGRRLEVAQPRGGVRWRAAEGDTLVIDAGAAVASVEAHGASLRVEVQMNLSDARMIGVSAATAAAVALVTVIVYQGHVNVTSGGRTVLVEPGGTLTVPAPEPAREAPLVGAATPSLEDMKRELRRLQQQIFEAEQERVAQQEQERVAREEPAPEQVPAAPSTPPPARTGCDATELAELGKEAYATGQLAVSLTHFERAFACNADPMFAEKAFVVACNLGNAPKAKVNYRRMTPMMRQRARAICIRNGISEDMLEGV
jgi:hypothetical protein